MSQHEAVRSILSHNQWILSTLHHNWSTNLSVLGFSRKGCISLFHAQIKVFLIYFDLSYPYPSFWDHPHAIFGQIRVLSAQLCLCTLSCACAISSYTYVPYIGTKYPHTRTKCAHTGTKVHFSILYGPRHVPQSSKIHEIDKMDF